MSENMTQVILNRTVSLLKSFGWPRLIIAIFLLVLFIAAPLVGVNFGSSLSNTLMRFGMNSVLVLAMVPMIHSGCGLNFGLPLGDRKSTRLNSVTT